MLEAGSLISRIIAGHYPAENPGDQLTAMLMSKYKPDDEVRAQVFVMSPLQGRIFQWCYLIIEHVL